MAYFIFIPSIFLAAIVLVLAVIRPRLKRNANSKMLREKYKNRRRTQINARGEYVIIE